MAEFLKSLEYAALSPYAFVAYVVVVMVWLVTALRVKRNKQVLESIENLPEKHRLEALRLEMGAVLPKDITPEQWLKSRIYFFYFFAFAICCLVLVIVLTVAHTLNPNSNPALNSNEVIVTVSAGNTARLFGDELKITLNEIQVEDNPQQYKVNAFIASPDYPILSIQNGYIGYILSYNGVYKYDIQILEVNSFSATFVIIRKDR